MKLFKIISDGLDKLSLVAKVAVVVLGTKDKTTFNHIADGLDKAKRAKDVILEDKNEKIPTN